MGSLAVVILLVFGISKLLRGIRSLLQSACDDLERWHHLDDRPYVPIAERSSAQAGIHTRLNIRRLARELQQMTEARASTFDPDPVTVCLFVGPPDAGQTDVARAMASAVGVPLLSVNLHVTSDTESFSRLLRSHSPSRFPSSERIVFLENMSEATLDMCELLSDLLRTGTIQDQAGYEVSFHRSIIIVAMTMASDFMEDLYALPERELRDLLSHHPACAEMYAQQIVARAHIVLPFCYPSHDALCAVVVERLPIALRFMGYARLRVDDNVVDALAHEVKAAGYPLIDIDSLLYDHLAHAVREAALQRPWFAAVRSGRLVVVEELTAGAVPTAVR